MSSQRYERLDANDEDDRPSSSPDSRTPDSPPPSFRSRASSINRHHSERERLVSEQDQTLADTFDSPSDDESEDESSHRLDDRQRVMSGRPSEPATSPTFSEPSAPGAPRPIERRVTQLPVFPVNTFRGGASVNDGVFANLSAKPERPGEADMEEKPPTYEQAAADATPPYWETTILTPGGASSDEVFIDGLPVGSLFSFVWNGVISMSFQLVGFLLTYLLHTTHAAKNGSKAGLGITLIQYGFSMRSASSPRAGDGTDGNPDFVQPPADPNSHDFDPSAPNPGFVQDGEATGVGAMHATDWFAYALMIAGWFIMIKAITEYLKARRHELVVLQSPSRGLNVPVVAEGETPNTSV